MMLDEYFVMKKVLDLAKKGEGNVSPNPLVGAIITKGNKIISEGFHKKAGLPHAEIEAINKAKGPLRGAKLFVNIEPCCIWGKTPPCVDKIISSGIKEVIFSTLDPNPKVHGKGAKKLRKAGIKIKIGLLKKEATRVNEIFFKNMLEKRPFIVAKVAQSLDGKITTRSGESKWITSQPARNYSRRLRDKYDAVLIGINTVINDNPTLDGLKKIPYKIVLDPYLNIPLTSRLVKKYRDKLLIFSLNQNKRKLNLLRKKGVKIFTFQKNNILPLRKIADILYKLNIMSVFIEGGSFTLGSFFDAQLVDKIYFFVSPKIIGGNDALSSIGAKGIISLKNSIYIKDIQVTQIGPDFLFIGYPIFN